MHKCSFEKVYTNISCAVSDETATSSSAASICMDVDENIAIPESDSTLMSQTDDDSFTELQYKDKASVDSNTDKAKHENTLAEVQMEMELKV